MKADWCGSWPPLLFVVEDVFGHADVAVAHGVPAVDVGGDEAVDHVQHDEAVVSHADLHTCQMQCWVPLPLKPLLSPPANGHIKKIRYQVYS